MIYVFTYDQNFFLSFVWKFIWMFFRLQNFDPLVLKPPDQACLLLLQGAGQLSYLSSRITYFMAILQAQVSITCSLPTLLHKKYLAHPTIKIISCLPCSRLPPLTSRAPWTFPQRCSYPQHPATWSHGHPHGHHCRPQEVIHLDHNHHYTDLSPLPNSFPPPSPPLCLYQLLHLN